MKYRLSALVLAMLSSMSLAAQLATQTPQVELDPVTQSRVDTWTDTTATDSVRVDAAIQLIRSSSSPDTVMPPGFFGIILNGFIEMADTTTYLRGKGYGLHMKAVKASSEEQFAQSIQYLRQSSAIFREIKDTFGMLFSEGTMGSQSMQAGDYERARVHLERSIEIESEIGMSAEASGTRLQLARVLWEMEDTTAAIAMAKRCLNEMQDGSDWSRVTSTMMYGAFIGKAVDLDSGLAYLHRALDMTEGSIFQFGRLQVELQIGRVYLAHGQYDQARKWCMKPREEIETVPHYQLMDDLCECLYESNRNLGNTAVALTYLEKIREREQQKNVGEMARQLDLISFDQRLVQDSLAHQVAIAEEQRSQDLLRNGLIAGGVIFLLVGGGLYSRNRYMKRSNDVITQERDRSDSLLLNILPAEIARELKERGESSARDFDDVTILFTDFIEFTETAERMDAKDLVDELNVCFKQFDEIVGRHGIEKIKTIGDAYMAAGGVPVPDEQGARKVVLAALEMAEFIANRERHRTAEGKSAFRMRTGINTGPVVAGIVGVKKFQYDIWGDTVNTASRMESYGEAGKVNISQSTYQLLKDDPQFRFTPRGAVDVKGKGEIEMWFVRPS